MNGINSDHLKNGIKRVLAALMVLTYSTIVHFEYCRGFEFLSFINTVLRFLQFALIGVVILMLILSYIRHRFRMSKTAALTLVLYLYIAAVTAYNGYNFLRAGLVANILLPLLFDTAMFEKDETMFKGWLHTLEVMTVINFITILLFVGQDGFDYREGASRLRFVYFLHYDNGHVVTTFPVMCFNLMLYLRNHRKRHLLFVVIVLAGYCITFSATSLVMSIVFFAALLAYRYFPMLKSVFLNKTFLLAAILVLFVGMIVLGGYKNLVSLFVLLFNKNLTLNRAGVFEMALQYIRKSILIGYGYVVDAKWIAGYNSGHNLYLNFMLAGGIIGLALFIWLLFLTLGTGRRQCRSCKELYIMYCGVIAYMVAGMAEGYDTYASFYLFLWMCISLAHGDGINAMLDAYSHRSIRFVSNGRRI